MNRARVERREIGGQSVEVAIIPGGRSGRDVAVAMRAAERDLAGHPTPIVHVSIEMDRHSLAQLQAAEAKRARRAARRG